MAGYLQDPQQERRTSPAPASEAESVLTTVGHVQESIFIFFLLVKLSHS